jgi:hypothetical protein
VGQKLNYTFLCATMVEGAVRIHFPRIPPKLWPLCTTQFYAQKL